MSLVPIYRALADAVRPLRFAEPVTHVYSPLDYARCPAERYLERWGSGTREVLLVGMNPGPWGMAQTGVPFGEVRAVKTFLGIDEPVERPEVEHPQRPVTGFACKRSEVSGARLWGWARARFGTAEQFFARFFVLNYCPLSFMEEGGRNLTPDHLPSAEAAPLFAACDTALRAAARQLAPRVVFGVGRFAATRARVALHADGFVVATLPHPSPANPRAHNNWGELAEEALAAGGVSIE